MTVWLDAILKWAALQLPETKSIWIEDLRQEARHIPMGFQRFLFLLGGIYTALGEVLRVRWGPRRVGQGLVGLALFGLCFAIGAAALAVDDAIVQIAFYGVVPIYGLAGSLAVFNLRFMKRYTVFSSLIFAVIWIGLGFDRVLLSGPHMEFLRAFVLEAAFIMAGLFIAASYLGWIEDTRHA